MRLNPPKTVTFVIAVVAIILGIIGDPEIAVLGGYEEWSFWLLAGGGVLMSLGALVKGL